MYGDKHEKKYTKSQIANLWEMADEAEKGVD